MLATIQRILDFLNANLGLITLVVGLFAIYLYLKGKKDQKRNAALLILQEIRYAEQRVKNYKTYGEYSFAEKLLPTNSWHTNINLFVKELNETDIDTISKFYSSAAYLDQVINEAATFQTKLTLSPPSPPTSTKGEDISTQIATTNLQVPAKELIAKISDSIEYIYNTPTISKMRQISEKRWYHLL